MKTADISDDQLNERYRNTAIFTTLYALLQRDDSEIYKPEEALVVPTRDEITSRWPGLSGDQVEGLQNDFNTEQDILGEFELGDVHDRIVELAQTELQSMWDEEDA